MKKKKSNLFNPAFEGLETTLKKPAPKASMEQEHLKHTRLKPKTETLRSAQGDNPLRCHSERSGESQSPGKANLPDDAGVFTQAMSGVVPIDKKAARKTPAHEKKTAPPYPAPDVEQEVMEHLRDLVDGTIDMDITFSDEYIEGSISGMDRNTMRRLKRGLIPVQDHIDLHGLTQKDAEVRVREFLIKSQVRGLQCVLIVHGRGLNSPDSIPVLKERLPVWLNRGPARKIVKAFASARPYDGGTGAIYVLLRKRRS
jgi:DNA-nicking Smr family endonuclease